MNISRGIGYKNNILRATKVNLSSRELEFNLVALFINCGENKVE